MNHPAAAEVFNRNTDNARHHDRSLWFIRNKRDVTIRKIPEWEQLRDLAAAIKEHTLSHLDQYLEQFEKNALANDIKVHWAADAAEHNQIITDILQSRGVKKLIKSKSMLTEECGLNKHLFSKGIEVIDSDLGERIMQLSKEPPSHIVLPAIHKRKEEIGELFHREMGTEKGATDPTYLTNAARENLRKDFLSADAALTGVNFGIAETGGFVVCTNEGNADLGVHLKKIHIAAMGIEKLIPRRQDLGVFLRLLARSATGQPITIYSSHFQRPKPGCEMHLVIVDNGRSEHLGEPDFYRALRCIRCGACMNTCPIYRRSGGHSYNYTIPGPIGSVLTPRINMDKFSTLPFASTLCGSCTDVCPVKIDLHEQLYKWRQRIVQKGKVNSSKKLMMKMANFIFSRPTIYRSSGKLGRWALSRLPRFFFYNQQNTWGKARELPEPPKTTFRDWYLKNRKQS